MPQMQMQTPMDLFVHELSDIRSAETIIAETLIQAQNLTVDPQIRQGLQQHEQETRQQIQNLDQVFQQLGATPHPIECHAARGLQRSMQDVVQSNPSQEVLEGAIVAGACKTEHLEIAAYTGLVQKAQAMGQREVAQVLQQNLQQEQAMLQRLETVAQQLDQQMAAMAGAQGGQQATAPAQ